ncbi:hypothetical protein ACFL27_22410 [candidate division CSSED10-310 bacterium]|uniref:PsbP C-terminal domain-containing protein n=1 Tax=candidate division CSSED10-310 bacterium TaxID=2855610 RepID=A0ABV6Z3N5_UNCC1
MMKRLLVALAILTIAGCTRKSDESGQGQFFATANGSVEFQFPAGWFKSKEDNPYDLQCFSKHERMTTGVFLFAKEDLAEDFTARELFEKQIGDLKSKRKNFKVLEEEQKVLLEKKTLTTIVFSGEKGSSKYYYKFTLVEFAENPEMSLVVLQVAIPSYWTKHKPILEEITKSGRVRVGEPREKR